MQGEGPLDPDAETQLPDSEGLTHPAALATDHHALEHLHALAAALGHADVDLQGVTGSEGRHIVAEMLLIDDIGGLHGWSS